MQVNMTIPSVSTQISSLIQNLPVTERTLSKVAPGPKQPISVQGERVDQRSVSEITAGPLFKNLDYILNPEDLKAFKTHTGEWDDYRLPPDVQKANALKAEAVLRFIDRQGGADSTAENGKIDGEQHIVPMLLDPQSEYFSFKGSEARLVLAFARGGYPALMDAANDAAQKKNAPLGTEPAVRGEANVSSPPSREETRPAGDQRSAEDIFDVNPILNTGIMREIMDRNPQEGYPLRIRDALIRRVGDFTKNNPDPESRADAMYRLAHVAHFIDNDPSLRKGQSRRPESGRLGGLLDDPKTEIGKMVQFSRSGYEVLNKS
jgi:hypothetical protein